MNVVYENHAEGALSLPFLTLNPLAPAACALTLAALSASFLLSITFWAALWINLTVGMSALDSNTYSMALMPSSSSSTAEFKFADRRTPMVQYGRRVDLDAYLGCPRRARSCYQKPCGVVYGRRSLESCLLLGGHHLRL